MNSWARWIRNGRSRSRRWPVMLLALLLWQASPAPVWAVPPVDDVVAVSGRVAVRWVAIPLVGVRDDAAMMIVGAALIGLASMLRRAA